MTKRYQLTCTADDWHALKVAVDKPRSPVDDMPIKVPLGALDRLMQDHSLLIQLHKGEVIE